MPLVIYTAAHGGFAGLPVPLGGGAAVSNFLLEEWRRTKPFPLRLIEPSILGREAPSARDIVAFSERQYAKFCHAFERRATEEILKHDPASTVVLANDISEGPDFSRLAERGYRVHTIYHVDVVAYIAAIYLRGRVSPEQLTRWTTRTGDWWMPAILRLIFQKQRATMLHSQSVIVPSRQMRETLIASYPEVPADRVRVLPWGAPPVEHGPAEISVAAGELRNEFGIPRDALVMLTLSRISPEKGQDLLLEALIEWERRGLPPRPLWLFVCGEPAFMQGAKHMQRLRALAAKLRRIKVVFPGYAMDLRKQAFFKAADLYVFPSRHESYGLTLMEAMQAGLPAVCLDHAGAREVMRPEFGEIASGVNGLSAAIERMLADPARLARQGERAREFVQAQPFAETARRLAELLA